MFGLLYICTAVLLGGFCMFAYGLYSIVLHDVVGVDENEK